MPHLLFCSFRGCSSASTSATVERSQHTYIDCRIGDFHKGLTPTLQIHTVPSQCNAQWGESFCFKASCCLLNLVQKGLALFLTWLGTAKTHTPFPWAFNFQQLHKTLNARCWALDVNISLYLQGYGM